MICPSAPLVATIDRAAKTVALRNDLGSVVCGLCEVLCPWPDDCRVSETRWLRALRVDHAGWVLTQGPAEGRVRLFNGGRRNVRRRRWEMLVAVARAWQEHGVVCDNCRAAMPYRPLPDGRYRFCDACLRLAGEQ